MGIPTESSSLHFNSITALILVSARFHAPSISKVEIGGGVFFFVFLFSFGEDGGCDWRWSREGKKKWLQRGMRWGQGMLNGSLPMLLQRTLGFEAPVLRGRKRHDNRTGVLLTLLNLPSTYIYISYLARYMPFSYHNSRKIGHHESCLFCSTSCCQRIKAILQIGIKKCDINFFLHD